MKPLRIGIFGGSFDPPHLGHLIVAEYLLHEADLNKIILVPAFQPPHKMGNNSALAGHRIAMTRLAARGNKHFMVSDYEIRRGGVSYTVDTLRTLTGQYPLASFTLIMGADSFLEFPSWKSPEEILSMADLVVYPRLGYETAPAGTFSRRAEFVSAPRTDISSSMIRRRVRDGQSIRYMVPESVERYIRGKKLYTRKE